jgi:hypothetical protein
MIGRAVGVKYNQSGNNRGNCNDPEPASNEPSHPHGNLQEQEETARFSLIGLWVHPDYRSPGANVTVIDC